MSNSETLTAWLLSRSDLPEAARNALARATGVTLPVAD